MNNTKEWQNLSITIKNAHPELTTTRIAEMVDVPRTTLRDYFSRYYSAMAVDRVDEMYPQAQLDVFRGISESKRFTVENAHELSGDLGKTQEIFKIKTIPNAEHLKFPTHFIIPDSQVKPDVDLSYLSWIGEYIVRKKPDVIVHLGDFSDLPSLSSYDKGKKSAEGKRLNLDITSTIEGMRLLLTPLYNLQQWELEAYGEIQYRPRMVLLYGNHEIRLTRHVDSNPELDGFLSLDDLQYENFGWETVEFLKPITLNGIAYCHYFPNEFTGKPLGGSALSLLKTLGTSFVQGHKQTLDHAVRHLPTNGKQQHGLICGAAYSHNEEYKGMNNAHWRGCVVAHRVNDGAYDPLFVSLDYLESEYGKD